MFQYSNRELKFEELCSSVTTGLLFVSDIHRTINLTGRINSEEKMNGVEKCFISFKVFLVVYFITIFARS